MINKVLYSALCIGHVIFAFKEWLPIGVSILIGAVIAYKTYKYIAFDRYMFLLQAFLFAFYL